MGRTADQERAADALKKIKGIEGKEGGNYVSYVSALPATIVMNGLGQALATELAQSKSKKDHRLLFEHVATWLGDRFPELRSKQPDEILLKLMENDQQVYVHAQVEAMAYLQWLKKFARAYLRETSDGSA